jgi:hypothetical protein
MNDCPIVLLTSPSNAKANGRRGEAVDIGGTSTAAMRISARVTVFYGSVVIKPFSIEFAFYCLESHSDKKVRS